jgi:F-type H+-transporting ATPase subunit gamma
MSLERIEQRRQAVATVHDVVNTMRAIAAGRIQAARRALESAREYHATVLRGLAVLLAARDDLTLPQREPRPTGLLIMTSEQALCGSFNLDVLALAERRLSELQQAAPVHLAVVGQIGLRHLAARGLRPESAGAAATSVEALRDLGKRLALVLGERYAAGEIETIRVIYSRYRSISEQVPTEELLVPIDPSQVAQSAPTRAADYHRYLPQEVLLAGLIREYVFISLYRIAAESFASEQASRLVAMDAATRNTERLLDELRDLERRERQAQITRQVLELINARASGGRAPE